MYTIKIFLRSPITRSEILPEDLTQAEVVIENIVSQALLELFDDLEVENVVVIVSPDEGKMAA